MFYVIPDAIANQLIEMTPDAAWFVEGVGYVVDDKRLSDLENGDKAIADAIRASVMENGQLMDGDALDPFSSTGKLVELDQTYDATYLVVGDDIHPEDNSLDNKPTPLEFEDKQVDDKWSRELNEITFDGEPKKVRGFISIRAIDDGVSNFWSRPKLRVSKNGVEIDVLDDLAMQQNTAYDGDAVINGIFYDESPGANPKYTFEWFDNDRRTATLKPTEASRISLEAIVKVKVRLA